ncbi:MAG: hypothetical protein J5885_03095 [Clostridia bacterium]|nr:hypothetical protein [Clostridia bacterium]
MMKRSEKKTEPTVRATGEDAYFAASNSAGGFHSYYSACFDHARVGRLYAVKGGPGTGKSRFLREVAKRGEAGGWHAEYIYCSSDPDSLDGVILTQKEREGIALLDATAPHVYEPSRPGYREEIVNLGAFWNGERLREERDAIAALNRKKQNAYGRTYRYLAGYGEMTATRDELAAPFLRADAIANYAEKLMKDVPEGETFSEQTALIRSVGMCGAVTLDTFFAASEKRYCVEDCRGSAWALMGALYRIAAKKKLKIRVSYDPVLPEKIDGLFLSDAKICFAVSHGEKIPLPHRVLSTRRFVETGEMHDIRGELNFAERMRRAMLEGALEQLEEVRKIHFSVEDIYIRAMDFEAKERFTEAFCKSLFGE